MTTLSPRFSDALVYAALVHRNQPRKGSGVPYIGHLLGVTDIVLGARGDEDEAIAALLHDAAEDQGGQLELEQIRLRFGDRVARIVEALSDDLPEKAGARKQPWHPRKEAYHQHLRANPDASVWLVSAADKLNNARATLSDLRADGPVVWERFSAVPSEQVWNYGQLLEIYRTSDDPRLRPIVDELARVFAGLKEEAAKL